MSDLGDELRSTIEGAATPVTLDELATRTSSHERRDGRAPWRTFVAGVAAAVLVIVGAVVAVNLGDDDPPPTRIAAPTVVVGDIDLAVLSTSFDDDGARGPIDPSVVDAVRAVPGVAGAQGAMQRFVDVVPTALDLNNQPPASERSAIAYLVGRRGAALLQRRVARRRPPARSRSTSRSPRSTRSAWGPRSRCAPAS